MCLPMSTSSFLHDLLPPAILPCHFLPIQLLPFLFFLLPQTYPSLHIPALPHIMPPPHTLTTCISALPVTLHSCHLNILLTHPSGLPTYPSAWWESDLCPGEEGRNILQGGGRRRGLPTPHSLPGDMLQPFSALDKTGGKEDAIPGRSMAHTALFPLFLLHIPHLCWKGGRGSEEATTSAHYLPATLASSPWREEQGLQNQPILLLCSLWVAGLSCPMDMP